MTHSITMCLCPTKELKKLTKWKDSHPFKNGSFRLIRLTVSFIPAWSVMTDSVTLFSLFHSFVIPFHISKQIFSPFRLFVWCL